VRVIEYTQPRAGCVLTGVMQEEGSKRLLSVVCYSTECEAFGALLKIAPGTSVKISKFQNLGPTKIQLIKSTLLELSSNVRYPAPQTVSLLELSQSSTREASLTSPVRVTRAKVSKNLKFYPACAACRIPLIKDSELCKICPSVDAEIQFLVIASFIDDEGSTIRAFCDAGVIRKIFSLPEIPSSLEKLEEILDDPVQDSFHLLLTARSVKSDQRNDALVRFNAEFAFALDELEGSLNVEEEPPRRRRK
jgi:hypothetical protein